MSSVERFWADTLNARLTFTSYIWFEGKKQAFTTDLEGLQETAVVYDVYSQYCKRTNIKVETQIIFTRNTNKIFNFERKLVGINRTTGFELKLKEMIQKFNEYFKVEMIKYSDVMPYELEKQPENIPETNKKENKVVQMQPKQKKQSLYEEVKDIDDAPF